MDDACRNASMIGSARAILFAWSMCSSMRWNSATSVDGVDPAATAGRRRRYSSFTSTAISTESNRLGGWSVRPAAIGSDVAD
jgi:hypothetical protein